MIRKIILIILAVLSLFIISLDYTCGHSLEELALRVYCPLCDTFKSAKLVILILFIIVFIGIIPVLCCFVRDHICIVPSLYRVTVTPDRAPPATA